MSDMAIYQQQPARFLGFREAGSSELDLLYIVASWIARDLKTERPTPEIVVICEFHFTGRGGPSLRVREPINFLDEIATISKN